MKRDKGPVTIGEAARRAGDGIETIRFYERRGLIDRPPTPSADGFRQYDAETIQHLRFIREAQEIGFSLREIAELLTLRADPGADCAAVRERAVAKRDEVEGKIARLGYMRDALDALIARCPGRGALEACSILDATEHSRVAAAPMTVKTRGFLEPKGIRKKSPERRTNKMKTTTFAIEGMHCDGCAETIKALLAREPGVRRAETSFAYKEARVLHDPTRIAEAQLKAAIEKGGFHAATKDA